MVKHVPNQRSVMDQVLKAIAHLNYARTFDSFNANHTKNVRESHKSTAEKMLNAVETENQRLYDAYGTRLRSST